ncbi:30S ribosomal protein S9 [Candidatus Microgenomates bacterium]|nr:30S ribosomal protein S9 [Candidatus Microgenomates bacterium]
MAKIQNKDYQAAVGRRKEAVARVRLYIGQGESLVNGQPAEKYFPGSLAKILLAKPLSVIDGGDKYWFTAKVVGSGKNSQLEAVVHGIARALSLQDVENFRPKLKKAGLLKRDPRIRERRKVGTGGKARRQKQSPKR